MAIPNEDKKIRMSQKFNDRLKKHLMKLGWRDPKMRDSFIAVLNSYMFSGTNASQQRVITNYLDRGLDVLNIELKRVELQNDQEGDVVKVTPKDVEGSDEDPSQQVESVTPMTYKSIIIGGRNKRLSSENILKEEIKLQPRRKKIFKKLLEFKGDTNKKEGLLEIAINTILSERVITEQGDVNKGNFRTFFTNYLNDDKHWSSDAKNSIIGSILSIVENGAGNIGAQKTVVRELDLLVDKLSKLTKLKTATQTKNSQIAFQELATLSSKLRGWSSEFYSEFVNSILTLVGTAKSNKVKNFVIRKLSDIVSKIETKNKDEDGDIDAKGKSWSNKKEE